MASEAASSFRMTDRYPIIRHWTDDEEHRLRELIGDGKRPAEIAVALKRSLKAIRNRAQDLGLKFGRPTSQPTMNHPRRQYLQGLRDGGWVPASELPGKPRLRQTLLDLGWIECDGVGPGLRCRITWRCRNRPRRTRSAGK